MSTHLSQVELKAKSDPKTTILWSLIVNMGFKPVDWISQHSLVSTQTESHLNPSPSVYMRHTDCVQLSHGLSVLQRAKRTGQGHSQQVSYLSKFQRLFWSHKPCCWKCTQHSKLRYGKASSDQSPVVYSAQHTVKAVSCKSPLVLSPLWSDLPHAQVQ